MTSAEFVVWMKGFMAACNEFTATPKQWDKIKEVLENVQDYNDNPGLDDWDDWYQTEEKEYHTESGSKVWNDKMGCWHYENYPEGSGYYTNSTIEGTNKKQQLND